MKEKLPYSLHVGASPTIFKFAERLRKNMTTSERKLWDFLRHKPNGFKFRRQHPFGIYILDFYCHKTQLAIEIDGEYHERQEQKKLDQTRTEYINQFGITELRFKDEEVFEQFDFVIEKILSFCNQASK